MPPIVNDRVAWSVGLSVDVYSEHFRKFGRDRDSVCVQDSGGPRETVAYSAPIRVDTYCIAFIQHNAAFYFELSLLKRDSVSFADSRNTTSL